LLFVVTGPVETEPEVAPPVENPVPVQLAAFVELHERVDAFPVITEVGLAVRFAVGVGADTETAVHAPQLLPSLLSAIAPVPALF